MNSRKVEVHLCSVLWCVISLVCQLYKIMTPVLNCYDLPHTQITRTPQPLFEEPEEETEPIINTPAVVVETAKKSSEPLKPVKTSGGGESPKAVTSGKKKAKAKKEGEVVGE